MVRNYTPRMVIIYGKYTPRMVIIYGNYTTRMVLIYGKYTHVWSLYTENIHTYGHYIQKIYTRMVLIYGKYTHVWSLYTENIQDVVIKEYYMTGVYTLKILKVLYYPTLLTCQVCILNNAHLNIRSNSSTVRSVYEN